MFSFFLSLSFIFYPSSFFFLFLFFFSPPPPPPLSPSSPSWRTLWTDRKTGQFQIHLPFYHWVPATTKQREAILGLWMITLVTSKSTFFLITNWIIRGTICFSWFPPRRWGWSLGCWVLDAGSEGQSTGPSFTPAP